MDSKPERNFEGGKRSGSHGASQLTAHGWAGWLLARLGRMGRPGASRPRLAVLERISLAPRQSLALVEADGRRLLIATSAEGAPAFYALEARAARSHRSGGRISW